jgi:dihydropteroate synthase
MGILNITPDSFYEKSRFWNIDEILQQAGKMLEEGAVILDIGGQSTRPGSQPVSAQQEMERILPAIEAIHKQFPEAFISVDTYVATVAAAAVQSGACIVNDISGGHLDEEMLPTVAALNTPFICMHIKGTPATMQQLASYKNVSLEVLDFFIQQTEKCRQVGIHDIILDPGFGFAKTIQHNFELLKNLSCFTMLKRPVMVGISRKSTIYKTLNITAGQALNGSTVLHTIALLNGANILRVHDVKEAVEAIAMVQAYQQLSSSII